MRTGGIHSKFDVTPWGRARGGGVGGGGRVQYQFCTNIVMLHIKSKVMKSKIQWGKHFAPGARLGSLEVKK